MHKKMECPICKKKVLFVGVHDDEGNYHGLVGCEYENDPWSGLSYALHHDGWGDCPLCTDGAYSTMGEMLFDTAEDAISALSPPNEWVSVEDALPERGKLVIVCVGGEVTVDTRLMSKTGIIGDWAIHQSRADSITHWMHLLESPYSRPPEGAGNA